MTGDDGMCKAACRVGRERLDCKRSEQLKADIARRQMLDRRTDREGQRPIVGIQRLRKEVDAAACHAPALLAARANDEQRGVRFGEDNVRRRHVDAGLPPNRPRFTCD